MSLQPALFDSPSPRGPGGHARRGPLDAVSEDLLACFQRGRLDAGAHPVTVAREVSQLRSLARELQVEGPLQALFRNPATLARVLLEPGAPISAATGRCRLVAAQRFV